MTWLVALGPLAVTVAVIAAFTPAKAAVSEAVPAATGQQGAVVRTPGAGSATGTGILDAVRKRVGVKSRFKIGHVRATERWAFVRCVEMINDGEQLQETDLDIAALLEHKGPPGAPAWEVVELWSLSTESEQPYTPFA